MAEWELLFSQQANTDSPTFTAYHVKGEDAVKIVVKTIYPRKQYTMYFDNEEIEDFYYFIEGVKELTV